MVVALIHWDVPCQRILVKAECTSARSARHETSSVVSKGAVQLQRSPHADKAPIAPGLSSHRKSQEYYTTFEPDAPAVGGIHDTTTCPAALHPENI